MISILHRRADRSRGECAGEGGVQRDLRLETEVLGDRGTFFCPGWDGVRDGSKKKKKKEAFDT